MKLVENEKGTVWYGLHFYSGVAEYADDPKQKPYRVYLNEDTLRRMDPTFAGRPIFVRHVDEVEKDVSELRKEADGWVVESFYNAADGKHWAKFITVTQKATEAIRNGWRLSNAYIPKSFGSGGVWNGVEYLKEITAGEYEHLAIVPNPRYDESVILTPEQFKQHNQSKEVELKRLANSLKGEPKVSILNIFKKEKVENSADLESMMVTLPVSKKDVTIAAAVKMADESVVKNMHGYANGDHMVKVGEEEMSVNDLGKKYSECLNAIADMKAKAEAEKKENEDKEEDKGDKKKNEADKEEGKKNFDKLANAPTNVPAPQKELVLDGVELGASRYGSQKA